MKNNDKLIYDVQKSTICDPLNFKCNGSCFINKNANNTELICPFNPESSIYNNWPGFTRINKIIKSVDEELRKNMEQLEKQINDYSNVKKQINNTLNKININNKDN